MGRVRKINKKKAAATAPHNTGSGGSGWFSIEEFDTPYKVRVLPPMDDMETPWMMAMIHYREAGGKRCGYDIDGDEQRRGIYCLEFHGQDLCPICECARWMEANDMKSDAIKAQRQYYINVVSEGKLMIWNAKPSCVKQLNEFLQDEDYGEDMFGDETGRDVKVTKTGNPKQWNTIRYSVTPAPKVSRIQYVDWKDDAATLTDLVKMRPYNEVVEIAANNLAELVPVGDILKFNPSKKDTAPEDVKKKAVPKGKKVAKKKVYLKSKASK